MHASFDLSGCNLCNDIKSTTSSEINFADHAIKDGLLGFLVSIKDEERYENL